MTRSTSSASASNITGGGILSPVEDIASDVTTLLGKGCVKSVQRGSVALNTAKSRTAKITRAQIDPAKSIVLLIGDGSWTTSGYFSNVTLAETYINITIANSNVSSD